MRDILGREIIKGDLVVGKGTGRHVIGMSLGIWTGSSMIDANGTRRSMNQMYLVENPSDSDLVIKNKIRNLIDKNEKLKEEKAKIKCIPLGKLEVGGIYKSTNNENYLYLGKKTVKVDYHNGYTFEKIDDETGHCFAFVGKYKGLPSEELLKEAIGIAFGRSYYHSINILKGNKKLQEKVHQIDVPEHVIITEERERSYGFLKRTSTITIE